MKAKPEGPEGAESRAPVPCMAQVAQEVLQRKRRHVAS